MENLDFNSTVVCLTFTPCGNFLIAGDTYGRIFGIHLAYLMDSKNDSHGVEITPINSITVKKKVKITCFLAIQYFLLVGIGTEVCAFDWNSVKYKRDAEIAWRIKVIGKKGSCKRPIVHSMIGNANGLLYVGCADGNLYEIDTELGFIVRTFSGHKSYVNTLSNFDKLVASGSDDGIVHIWDLRNKENVVKVTPYHHKGLSRPLVGTWIGAVCIREDALLCGGGPKMALWSLRSLKPSVIYPIEDGGIHIAEFYGDKVLGTGKSKHLYTMTCNGQIISKLPTSSITTYSIVHHEKPFKVFCMSGSSCKLDICSNFNTSSFALCLTYISDDVDAIGSKWL